MSDPIERLERIHVLAEQAMRLLGRVDSMREVLRAILDESDAGPVAPATTQATPVASSDDSALGGERAARVEAVTPLMPVRACEVQGD